MRIGVLSDSKDELWNLERALGQLKGAEAIVHCGNFYKHYMFDALEKAGVPVYVVFGDEDDCGLTATICEPSESLHLCGKIGKIVLDNKRLLFTHFPHRAEKLAKSDVVDAVFHGDSASYMSRVGGTLLASPGAVGNRPTGTYGIYDTVKNGFEIHGI